MLTVATTMAGRGTDIALGPGVAAAAGLHVIITEYHESRRIDRQLLGRAARQGDPGSFEATVAADDELFRLFARSTLAGLIGNMPFRALPLRLLQSLAQAKAEGRAAAARRRTMRAEREIHRSLASAGRPDWGKTPAPGPGRGFAPRERGHERPLARKPRLRSGDHRIPLAEGLGGRRLLRRP